MSNEAVRAALAAARYGAWMADVQGALTYVDPAFLQMLGRSAEEVLGSAWIQWLAPEVRHLNELAWRTAIAEAQSFERFHAFITADGQRQTVHLRANPIRDAEGKLTGWAGLHLDPPNEVGALAPITPVERFLESTTDAFVALDRDFRFTYVNHVAAELVQRRPSEMLGKSHWELFPTLLGTRIEHEYRRAMSDQVPIHFEWEAPQIGVWLDVHVYPTPEGIAIYFRDVSERRRTEERLTTALTGARAGVWEWDIGTDATTWSPQMFELLELDRTELASRERFFERLHPDDRGRFYAAAVKAIDETSELAEELRVGPIDPPRWILAQAKVVRGENGNALRLIGLAQDITERRRAEDELRRTQQSFALAMKAGRMGWWIRNLDPDRVEWSPELEAIFGLEPGGFTGLLSDYLERIHPDDLEHTQETVRLALANREDYRMEFRFRHASGAWRWMEGRGRATYDEGGRPVRVHGVGIDITERKAFEARYERLANLVPCLVWVLDGKGHTRWVNDRWYELTGLGEAPASDDWMKVLHPEDVDRTRPVWWECLRTGMPYEAEVRYRSASGEYRWFLERGQPVLAEDGTVSEWFGTSIDIHDRKQEEERIQLLLDTMPLIAWSTRGDGQVDFLNQHYLDFCGVGQEARGEMGWTLVVHPEDQEEAFARYRDSFENGTVWEQELRLKRHDGQFRWHLSRSVPLRNAEGVVYRWFGTSTDIHDQKLKEQTLSFLVRLHEATRQIEGPLDIVQTTSRLLCEHLRTNRVAYAEIDGDEDHFEILGDYTKDASTIVGRHRLLHFGEQGLQDLRSCRTLVIYDTEEEVGPEGIQTYRDAGIRSMICVPLHKGGRFVAGLAAHSSHPRDWEPEEIHLIEMVAERCWADLERARADRQLRELNQELEMRVQDRTAELVEANREMEGFTYTVSHDLRAPLRAITATSMILLEEASEKLGSEERALLERQAHNAKHLGVLIDELLKLSRISRQEMARTRFNLTELAGEVAEELRDGRSDHVQIEIQPELWARGDAKLVRFVLLNLFENACKFSPNGGTIRLGSRDGVFFVKDEGIGFDPRYVDKLFRPFERLVNQSDYPGTGIGLANVKRIVERHGGQVWAESAPGEGATFWFTLGPTGS